MKARFRTTPPGATQVNRSRSDVLLQSVFDTLPSTPPGIIDAMTLSVPVESDDEAAALQKLALELADEYGLHAEIAVDSSHLTVRVSRR